MRRLLVSPLFLAGAGCAAIAGLSDHTAFPPDAGLDGESVAPDADVGALRDAAGHDAGSLDGAPPADDAAHAPCISVVLKPVDAVSSPGAERAARLAIDGDLRTRFDSRHGVDPQWIYVDLGARAAIGRARILWENACGRDYALQVSDDAQTWATARSIVGNTAGDVQAVDFTRAADHQRLGSIGRYLRVYGTARCTMYGYSIWELEISGDPDPGCR